MLDIKIINGTVVDGTGSPRFAADIGVRDGYIACIGKTEEDAAQVIDAAGKIVAPGFIDVHTHYDAQVFWDPTLSPSCYHGVTTVFGGFCGFSIAPLTPEAGEYLMPMLARVEGMPLESLEQGVPWDWTSFGSYLEKIEGRIGLNAGFMAGHSAIRRVVMGDRAVGERANDDDLKKMKRLLAESLSEGAMGFSTTVSPTHNDADGQPVPSRHASRDEFLQLAGVCGQHEGTTLELLPNFEFDPPTVELLTDFSLAANRPVNWNVLVAMGSGDAEMARLERQLAATDHARERNAEVVALTIPQSMSIRINLFSGFVFDSFPGWGELFQLSVAERIERLKDPDVRKALKEGAAKMEMMASLTQWEQMTITETFSEANRDYAGCQVGDVAAQLGKEPFDAMLDIAIQDGLKTSFMPPVQGEDKETYRVRANLWKDDRTVVGASDAGAHLDMIDTFAFSSKLLQKGVREYELLSLEEAVQQLTEVPARLMGLKKRGSLKEGWYADMVVLDPEQVGCGDIYTRHDLPTGAGRLYMEANGVDYVVVNGQCIIEQGAHTGKLPGHVIRSGIDTDTVTAESAKTR